jgi:hypothetical protein
MKKLLPITALLLAACSQNNEHTDSFVHAKVDSIVGARMNEINQQAMDDLDKRMTIEVKQKADSIIAARKEAQRVADSAAQASAPAPVNP